MHTRHAHAPAPARHPTDCNAHPTDCNAHPHTHAPAPARAYTTRSPLPWHLTCPRPVAALRGLAASTEYSYQVVSGDASSALLSFRTAPDASTLTAQLPHQFVIYGDLGHKVPTGSSTIMPYVTRDVRDGPPGLPRPYIDMVLHVGDFACARFQSGRSDLPAASRFQSGRSDLPAASSLVLRAARPTLLRPRSHALRPRLGPTPCMHVLTTAPSPRADSRLRRRL
jgi:hypothetical protein